jgi:hypothetical protein
MQFSPASCHFVSLRSKYSLQYPVLKHPQPVFLSYSSILYYLSSLIPFRSITIQSNEQKHIFV